MVEPLINLRAVSKTLGTQQLFSDVDVVLHDGARLAIIGANGSGKSTLLRLMSGSLQPDSGTCAVRSGAVISSVEQDPHFHEELSARAILAQALAAMAGDPMVASYTHDPRLERLLSQLHWPNPDQPIAECSGGWRKRLAIAQGLINEPDILLLDEPTNHLDFPGLLWLEELLNEIPAAVVMISHDRWFLQRCASAVMELGNAFPGGSFVAPGGYLDFLEHREAFLRGEEQRQASMDNSMRREKAWLAKRPKARATKSVARIRRAGDLQDDLSDLAKRNANARNTSPSISFHSSTRKTHNLIVAEGISKAYTTRPLFANLDVSITPGTRLGLVGSNGSGKSTLLKVLSASLDADSGTVQHANDLRIVTFDQHRSRLNPQATVHQTCCPAGGDQVVLAEGSMHINAFAQRFRFSRLQLQQQVGSLSGGEQARLLIATLMQQAADVLILDEPTNDLDIPALEELERSLIAFQGGLILITHDRYLLESVCNHLIALDGTGGAHHLASYHQWEEQQRRLQHTQGSDTEEGTTASTTNDAQPSTVTSALSYAEHKELRSLSGRIDKAEAQLARLDAEMASEAIQRDAERLMSLDQQRQEASLSLDQLMERWLELEEKRSAEEA
ncbi:MAG: ABC transporter ATP-binding protein [Planctomycetota bacterium]|nr:MAG: ABC transporter ATP-binding protein [Planctomycetota bacterium]